MRIEHEIIRTAFFPIQELGRELQIIRRGYHALFDVAVNYIPLVYDFTLEGPAVEVDNFSHGFAAPWAVTVANAGQARDMEVIVDYDSGLISADMAGRVACCLETLFLWGMSEPSCPIAALPTMTEAARAQVMSFAAGPAVALPLEATLATLCSCAS